MSMECKSRFVNRLIGVLFSMKGNECSLFTLYNLWLFPASSLSLRDNLLCCTGSQKEGQLKEGLRLGGIVLYAGGEFFFVYRVSITLHIRQIVMVG